MTQDFWINEIGKYADLRESRLTLRVEEDGRIELRAIEITFRDGERCVLIGEGQEDAEARYDFNQSRCLEATLSAGALHWVEERARSCSPRDRQTGKADYDQEFTAIERRWVVRRLDDIVGVSTYSLFEMDFGTFED